VQVRCKKKRQFSNLHLIKKQQYQGLSGVLVQKCKKNNFLKKKKKNKKIYKNLKKNALLHPKNSYTLTLVDCSQVQVRCKSGAKVQNNSSYSQILI